MNSHFVPLLALLAWATLWISVDSSSSLTYCSSVNTGTGSANFSIYQSNGNCEDHCSDSAFAILLDKNCWCSDVAPNEDDNVDTSKCDDNCPGYPDDSCGNADDSLYAYIQLGSPSSTASASSAKSTSTKSTSTSTSTSTTSSKTSTTSDTTTTAHMSVTETQTHGGLVTTITVDSSSATSTADSNTDTKDGESDSGLSGGSIAGIVVGVLGAIALIVAAIVFFLAKRRQNDVGNYDATGIDGRQSKGSQMSYANLGDNHSHTLSNGSSIPTRLPTFTDNRLNTGAMLRRDSDISLQDNEDYSRPVLRLTNPD